MTNPSGFVEILQSDIDEFVTDFEAVKTALLVYITQLKAAATPLPPASEAGLQQALADLAALEPPGPPLSV